MKKLQLLTLIFLSSAITHHNSSYTSWLPWPSNDELETKNVDISGVRNIEAFGLGNLIIEQCESCPEILTIVTNKSIMPSIIHKIYAEQLTFGTKNNSISTAQIITYYIILQNINKISIDGNLDMQSKGEIKTKSLYINKIGNGGIDASIDVEDLTIKHTGNGNIKLSGETCEQTINSDGNGSYNAYELTSQNTSITKSGTGNTYITTKNNLSYEKDGTGGLYYKGDPKTNGSKKGTGNVKKVY